MKCLILALLVLSTSLSVFGQSSSYRIATDFSYEGDVNFKKIHQPFSIRIKVSQNLNDLSKLDLESIKLAVLEDTFSNNNWSIDARAATYRYDQVSISDDEFFSQNQIEILHAKISRIVVFPSGFELGLSFQIGAGITKGEMLDTQSKYGLSDEEFSLIEQAKLCSSCRAEGYDQDGIDMAFTNETGIEFNLKKGGFYLNGYVTRKGDSTTRLLGAEVQEDSNHTMIMEVETQRRLTILGVEVGYTLQKLNASIYAKVESLRYDSSANVGVSGIENNGYTKINRDTQEQNLYEIGLRIPIERKKDKR